MSNKKKYFNNSGQAMVEFAIILPFLMVLVFGITEFGRYLFLKNTATNAAREGARKAVVTPLPWAAAQRSAIYSAATSHFHGKTAWNPVDIVPDPPSVGNPVTVTVSMPFASMVPNLISTPTSISASATMRCE